jgi:adenosine deaminase
MRRYAELHVHAEGTLEAEMAIAFAKRNKVELPFANEDELRARLQHESLQAYLDLYQTNASVLRTEEDFVELTNAYLAKAKAAGVAHAEISVDLQAHLARGVPAEAVLGGMKAAMSKSEQDFGISTGLILNFSQDMPVEQAEDAYSQAVAAGAELAAVGVCLSRADSVAAPFASLFGRARADGVHTVAHVGAEADNRVGWDCLHTLRVGRIGACQVQDRNLMYYLSDYSIPLTICPLANAALHNAEDTDYPLPKLLEEGVMVTINSESPAHFGGYLDANVAAVTEQFGLDDVQLDLLSRNSFLGSFLAEAQKRQLAGDLVPA